MNRRAERVIQGPRIVQAPCCLAVATALSPWGPRELQGHCQLCFHLPSPAWGTSASQRAVQVRHGSKAGGSSAIGTGRRPGSEGRVSAGGMPCTRRAPCSHAPVPRWQEPTAPTPSQGAPLRSSASQVPTAVGLGGAQPSGCAPSRLREAAPDATAPELSSGAGTLLPAESSPSPVGALGGLPPRLPPPQQTHLRSAAKRLKPLYR